MREITRIILHCTATPEGRWHDKDDIIRWHTDPPPRGNGWSRGGYHQLVLLDGTVETILPLRTPGIHVRGHNSDTIGICYVGGIDNKQKAKDTRTPEQVLALWGLIDGYQEVFDNKLTVHGHNEFSTKACPSFDVEHDMLMKAIHDMQIRLEDVTDLPRPLRALPDSTRRGLE